MSDPRQFRLAAFECAVLSPPKRSPAVRQDHATAAKLHEFYALNAPEQVRAKPEASRPGGRRSRPTRDPGNESHRSQAARLPPEVAAVRDPDLPAHLLVDRQAVPPVVGRHPARRVERRRRRALHRFDRVYRARTSSAISCPSPRSCTRRRGASARSASPACSSRPGAILRSWGSFADHGQPVLHESDLRHGAFLGAVSIQVSGRE